MKKENPFDILRKIINENEKEWQKDIDNTKRPIMFSNLKILKQDYKDLAEIETKLRSYELRYGICFKLMLLKK